MTEKAKEKFAVNHFHNILRLVNVLLNSSFTTSEWIDDYYL